MEIDQKIVSKIGWAASLLAIAMYFSYIDQIRLNIEGHPGSIVLPIITTFNCIFWVVFGFFLEKRNWQIIACNVPGIFLGIATAITAIQ